MGRLIIYDEPVIKVCPECGEEKPYFNNRQIYCRECADERTRKRRAICAEKYRREKLNIKPKKTRDVLKNRFTVKKSSSAQPSRTIEDILKFANSKGITYGKAVRLLEVGNG